MASGKVENSILLRSQNLNSFKQSPKVQTVQKNSSQSLDIPNSVKQDSTLKIRNPFFKFEIQSPKVED